ncbi:MAG: hypothetical protein EHM33_04390 [Chloroflexi bacterium]|jgi:hypothetical protein|nr:MAG: hypothetical protein EHM33_04390 [Chloroflexota bacterium]
MFTKPLTRQPVATLETSKDTDSITRLLVAAAINPRFCVALLTDPQHALQAGFGGEGFPLSQTILDSLVSIRASTLPEFAFKLNEVLSSNPRAT